MKAGAGAGKDYDRGRNVAPRGGTRKSFIVHAGVVLRRLDERECVGLPMCSRLYDLEWSRDVQGNLNGERQAKSCWGMWRSLVVTEQVQQVV